MRLQGPQGIPQRSKLRRKAPTPGPGGVRNLLEGDFSTREPNAGGLTDIICIRADES